MKRIAIHSAPRSGSSWLGQIFNSAPSVAYRYQPLFSYAFKDFLNENSDTARILEFFEKIQQNDSDEFLMQTEQLKKGAFPAFRKELPPAFVVYKEVRYHHILANMLRQDKELKVVGLIRNPLAVINSWLRAPREFRADLGWKEIDEWQFAPLKNLGRPEEFNGYQKWKEVTSVFESLSQEYPDRFYLLKYDDLISEPLTVITEVFSFCGIPLQQQTIDFVQKSSDSAKPDNDAYSVTKQTGGTDSDWKEQLNPLIIRAIEDDIVKTPFKRYLR